MRAISLRFVDAESPRLEPKMTEIIVEAFHEIILFRGERLVRSVRVIGSSLVVARRRSSSLVVAHRRSSSLIVDAGGSMFEVPARCRHRLSRRWVETAGCR
jgi:hypothetical protein